MKFKQITSLLLALMLLMGSLAACGKPSETTASDESTAPPVTETEALTGREAEKDNLPADLNYAGEPVTFFTRNSWDIWKYEMACEELLNNTLYDAIHYRNIDVENRLGVKINNIGQPGTMAEIAAWNQTLATSVLTNTGDYDGATIYASQSSPLAKDGIYYDFNRVSVEYGNGYVELSRPWWNQTLINEATNFGALFYLAGDLTISNVYAGYCMFFNKELFNERFPELGVETLYADVKNGTWTIDKLIDYVSAVWDDLDSSGTPTDGDVLGWTDLASNSSSTWMDGWLYAMGLSLTETNEYGEPEISLLNDPNTVPAFEKLQKLYYDTPGSYGTANASAAAKSATLSSVANGNVLFRTGGLNSGSEFKDSSVTYGVLPLAKFNEEQENYRTCFGNSGSFLILCSNLSEERAVMMSAVLEAMAVESYRSVVPTYYSVVLGGQYSKDQPDAEMYDTIINAITIDFGFIYSTCSIGGFGSIFRTALPGTDIQSLIDSKKQQCGTLLSELLSALEEIA